MWGNKNMSSCHCMTIIFLVSQLVITSLGWLGVLTSGETGTEQDMWRVSLPPHEPWGGSASPTALLWAVQPFLCRPSMERLLWAFMILHLCTTFFRNVPSVSSLIEKAKGTVLSGDEGILGGRNAITQAAPCQSANPEIDKCVCWWHLICFCRLCLGSLLYVYWLLSFKVFDGGWPRDKVEGFFCFI